MLRDRSESLSYNLQATYHDCIVDQQFGHRGFRIIPSALHTVAIWTFTFHKISGFVRVILKANFKQFCKSKVSFFLSENSHLLFSFSFQFLQNFKQLTYLNCDFCIKTQFKHVNSRLDIYISRNLKLCKGDFAGKFQIILQAKGINFLI